MVRTEKKLLLLFFLPDPSYSWQTSSTVDFHPGKITSRRHFSGKQLGVASTDFVPQANPTVETNALSLSGVSYESVLSGLNELYPPQGLHIRNAASRTDGYWKFISQGEEPPMDLTYGEFDFHFFAQLLDRAHHHYFQYAAQRPTSWDGKVFTDLGSGTGRLVLGAAALHPGWKVCRGIELLEGINNVAAENLSKCKSEASLGDNSYVLPYSCPQKVNSALVMAPVDLKCGSFDDPYEYLGDTDCAFVFSSCFSPELMEKLGRAIGRQFQPGSIIITTDYKLPLENRIDPVEGDASIPSGTYRLELVEKLDGWCWLTGGDSTAYIHRVVKSLS